MIVIKRKGEIESHELMEYSDDVDLANSVWLVFCVDGTEGECQTPSLIFTDYEKLKEWVKDTSSYGRVERWDVGVDHRVNHWQGPRDSHQHFGMDKDAEIVLIDTGDCADCEEDEVDGGIVLLHEEKVVDGHNCILEWYRCPECEREYGAFGVEGVNLIRFKKETPDEKLDFQELYELVKSEL